MNQSQREYADYLTRLARNSTKTAQEFNKENIVREVGKEYGLSEIEMDEVGKYEINKWRLLGRNEKN